jgi:hypothetical protein
VRHPPKRPERTVGREWRRAMPKQEMILTVAMALILSASSGPGEQNSPPPVAQKPAVAEGEPLRPGDFPLKAEVKKQGPRLTPSAVQTLEATGCKDLKGEAAIVCREGSAAAIRALQRVVAKISDHVYSLDGPQLPAGDYPARSVDDGKGFEFLTKDEKGNYRVIRYSIFQEVKVSGPPSRVHH